MSSEQLKGHLDALILAVLETGPAHGYAIVDQLRARSDGVFDLPEGTIYPALHRLERAGLATSRREIISGRERRVYRLSTRGRSALRAGRHDWRVFSATVSNVLGVSLA